MIPILSGLFAGSLHVLSGPDHLAAVAPITVSGWKRALTIGFRWGMGHAGGVIFVGLLTLLFRELLPIEALSFYAERLVGLILVGIGLWGARKALQTHVHTHQHTHDGSTHVHYHLHADGHAATNHGAEHQHSHAAFGVGAIHGVAGSSHFFGVLPALIFESQMESILYLVAYGTGTVVAMIGFSGLLGWVARRCSGRFPLGHKSLALGCSASAIFVGIYWAAGI